MPIFLDLLDRPTWVHLSNPLFCRHEQLLLADFASETPEYVGRKSPGIVQMCVEYLLNHKYSVRNIVEIMASGNLPAKPVMGTFLLHTGQHNDILHLVTSTPEVLTRDNVVSLGEFLHSLSKRGEEQTMTAVGICTGIEMSLEVLGLPELPTPSGFWTKMWWALDYNSSSLLRVLGSYSRWGPGTWWLNTTVSEENAQRWLALPPSSRAAVLENWARVESFSERTDRTLDGMLTAHESV